MKNEIKGERGSVLVLSLICVLILSFLVEGILDVSQTEIYTTQNYQLGRMAFYKALEGVEDVREQIAAIRDPEQTTTDVYRMASDTIQTEGGLTYSYITGDLVDLHIAFARESSCQQESIIHQRIPTRSCDRNFGAGRPRTIQAGTKTLCSFG